VGGRHHHVVVGSGCLPFCVGLECAFVIAREVIAETEVIPDVGVEGRDRDSERVGEAVGLDLVIGALDEGGSVVEVRNGLFELAGRDEAMTAVAVEAGILGM